MPEDHVALVTGANHGIGAATARALAIGGTRVALTYLRLDAAAAGDDPTFPRAYASARAGDAMPVVEAIRGDGGRAVAIEADLADPTTPARVFEQAEDELGPVDILVNNASAWNGADTFGGDARDRLGRKLVPVSASRHDAQFAVDARATALLISELARRHRERVTRWGRIVSVTSGGRDGFPHEVTYGAAKAALESYTLSAALELVGFGITANVVEPPVTDTGWISPAVKAAVEADGGRVSDPDEVAAVIAWLASDRSAHVNGQRIRVS